MSPPAVVAAAIAFLLLTAAAAPLAVSEPTAYDALQHYDLPVGLIPLGISSYKLNPDTGDFEGYWPSTCEFPIQNGYHLRYSRHVSGRASKDRLTNLKGISVKVLFFWLDIVEVERSGDTMQFSVGVASAGFGIDNFLLSPKCGCGFDCAAERKADS